MGTSPIVLDYTDKGSYYDVTIAFYGDYVFSREQGVTIIADDGSEEFKLFDEDNAIELITTQAPRAQLRINKEENEGLSIHSYKYIGYNY